MAKSLTMSSSKLWAIHSRTSNMRPDRSMVLRSPAMIARTVHAWIGASLALLIILIAATGTVLIWKEAYIRMAFAQHAQGLERDVDTLARIVLAAESAFDAQSIDRIRFGNSDLGISRLDLINKHAAYIAADGTVLEEWGPNGRPEDWVLDLHHRLLTGTTGLYVVGFAGIAVLVMILAGLVVYWPKRRHWRVGILPRSVKRPQLLLSHRNLGFLLILPIAIIHVSGVVLTFPDQARTVFYSTEEESYGASFGEGVDLLSGQSENTWARTLIRAEAVFPNAEITSLIWPNLTENKVITMRNSGEWDNRGNSSVHITAFDSMMGLRIDAGSLPSGERAFYGMRTLHTGGFRGWIYDLFLTAAGIGIVYLALIGLITFVSARLPKRTSA